MDLTPVAAWGGPDTLFQLAGQPPVERRPPDNQLWDYAGHELGFYGYLRTAQLVHCFSLTPHYGLRGFWTEHFTTTRSKAAFIEQVLYHPGSGTPNYAWRDVEREIGRRLRRSGLLDLYRQRSAGEQDAADRAKLARLMAKHGQHTPALDPGILRTVLVPVNRPDPL